MIYEINHIWTEEKCNCVRCDDHFLSSLLLLLLLLANLNLLFLFFYFLIFSLNLSMPINMRNLPKLSSWRILLSRKVCASFSSTPYSSCLIGFCFPTNVLYVCVTFSPPTLSLQLLVVKLIVWLPSSIYFYKKKEKMLKQKAVKLECYLISLFLLTEETWSMELNNVLLRWLNTVLAVCECMSLAKSW